MPDMTEREDPHEAVQDESKETPATSKLQFEATLQKQLDAIKAELTPKPADEKTPLLNVNPLSELAEDFPVITDEELSGAIISIQDLTARYKKIIALENRFHAIRGANPKHERTKQTDKIAVALEEYKAGLIRATLNSMREKHGIERTEAIKKTPRLKMRTFFSLTVIGAIYYFFDGYVNSHSILEVVTGLSPVLLITPIAFGAVAGILFYTLEAQSLKEEMNISERVPANKLLDLQDQKYDDVKRMGDILKFPQKDRVSIAHERDYLELLKVLQQDFRATQQRQNKQKTKWERFKRSCWKYIVLGVGALISALDGYFLATSLLTIFASAAFATTPVGWALAAAFMAIAVIFYYVLQKKGLLDLLDPMKNINEAREESIQANDDVIASRQEHVDVLAHNLELKRKLYLAEREVSKEKREHKEYKESIGTVGKEQKEYPKFATFSQGTQTEAITNDPVIAQRSRSKSVTK